MEVLPKREFLRAWCSVAYLYPGLHPDGFWEKENGWPRALQRFAAEAWRRSKAGQLTDNELYCYQATKARVTQARKAERMQREHDLAQLAGSFAD